MLIASAKFSAPSQLASFQQSTKARLSHSSLNAGIILAALLEAG
jgi:hypothetical protein